MKNLFSDIFDILFSLFMFLMVGYGVLCLLAYTAFAGVNAPRVVPMNERTVAITILSEARGEGEAGMYAVACVIEQRARNRKLKPSVICKQKKQFSCWNNVDKKWKERNLWTKMRRLPQTAYALSLAQSICFYWNNEKVTALDLHYVKHADHYHARSVQPHWIKGKLPVATIKNHVFYKLR